MPKIEGDVPAFPGVFTGHCGNRDHAEPCGCYVPSGMSLRDFFAAKAMPMATEMVLRNCETMAEWSYKMADAMLKARQE